MQPYLTMTTTQKFPLQESLEGMGVEVRDLYASSQANLVTFDNLYKKFMQQKNDAAAEQAR